MTKPWSERKKTAQQLLRRIHRAAVEDRGHSRDSADAAAAARRRKFPGGFRDRFAGRAAAARCSLPISWCRRHLTSGIFIYADSDLKFDQPQTEVVFDRDKLRSQGVDLSQAGQDLSTLLGGNYVNRFSIQGRSYKVIPQVKRAERLTARAALADLRHGLAEQAGAALHLRHV